MLDSTTEIAKTWHTGKAGSCALIIPKEMAQKHGIYQPSNVVIQETENGLLLRKLELNK